LVRAQEREQKAKPDTKVSGFFVLLKVENELISSMLNEGYWKKVEMSLFHDDNKIFAKVIIHHFFVGVGLVERVFWFDKTECF
jgi:hypothetical protein